MMKVFELVVADEEADGKGYTRRRFVEKRLPQPIVRRHAKKSTIPETVVSAEQHVSKSSIARQKRRRKKDVVVSLPKMQQPDRSISAPETLEIVAVAPTISFDSTKCRARRLEADAVEAYYRRRRVFPVEKAAGGNKAYRGFDRRSCDIVQNEIEAMKCISLRERFFELGLSPEYVEPFRKCSIEVVEAIVKWRMNTRRQFQWKQYPSYLEKMRGDLGSRNPLFLPLDDRQRQRIGELADEAYFQRAMRAHHLIFADDGPQTLLNKRTFVTEDETDRAPRFLHSRSLPAIRRKLTDGCRGDIRLLRCRIPTSQQHCVMTKPLSKIPGFFAKRLPPAKSEADCEAAASNIQAAVRGYISRNKDEQLRASRKLVALQLKARYYVRSQSLTRHRVASRHPQYHDDHKFRGYTGRHGESKKIHSSKRPLLRSPVTS